MKKSASVPVPFSLKMRQNAVKYGIGEQTLQHMHFNDLDCLLMQFVVEDIKEYLRSKQRETMRKRGIDQIDKISGNEALKLFGR